MTLDPLKSAMSIGNVEDTTLGLNKFHSGRQRVLEQVQTIKRTRSKYIKNGSGTLPSTSPQYTSVFTDSFSSLPANFNGSAFTLGYNGNGHSKTLGQEKNLNRRVLTSKGSVVQRNPSSSSQWDRRFVPISPPVATTGQCNTSRSEPDLGQFTMGQPSARARRLQSNRSNNNVFVVERSSKPAQFLSSPPSQITMNGASQTKRNSQFVQSNHSNNESKISIPKSKGEARTHSTGQMADITLKVAVEYLSSEDANYQNCGASFIQHNTYSDDKTKKEVFKLKGIPPLVRLLQSPNSQVQQTASAALRNLAFKNEANKEEVLRCGGIPDALTLLRDTDSSETQKQLTGLLWNLSSADSLKPELVSALPVLMGTVVVPFTGGPDHIANDNMDPEIFYHATGCLRNLSCAKQANRQAMRKCRGLIDSLVSYVQDCVAAGRPDDKSVENCVCVLHNLTFQLEAEAPALFSRITALAQTPSRANAHTETGPIGCFSQQSKQVEQESHFDYPVIEEQHPKGAGLLFHSKTLQSYLSLLGSSQRDDTLEACCGALQNLTAGHGIVSSVMSQNIVQKLNGLHYISPLLKSPKPNLQKSAVALLGNLAKNPRLQSSMARQSLPDLASILSSGTTAGKESDETVAMACQTANSLLLKEPALGKRLLTNSMVSSLSELSRNRNFPKASKAAGLLLYSLWSEKDIQSFLKKQGMNKDSFVNAITTAVHKSIQVIT